MKEELQKITEHENENWSKIFDSELRKNNKKKFSSYWWEDYYQELTSFVNRMMLKNKFRTVLEAGSGSGKATILLDDNFSKTLLDISPVALKYAAHLAKKFECQNVKYVEGDIFEMPFKTKSFDFVWNIGVIEHYSLDQIELIIEEMTRVCSKNGAVAIGMPNFYSGPILKAWLLKIIKIIPGYRLDTEKFYKTSKIEDIFKNISEKTERRIDNIQIEYFGNPSIIEMPKFIIKLIGKPIARIFRKNKFLTLIMCKFK